MDGCLSCKSCVGQCPVKVDVPAFRAKFLELYHGRYLRPVRDRLLGTLKQTLPLLLKFPRLYNRCVTSRWGKLVLCKLGVAGLPVLTGVDIGEALAAKGIRMAIPETLANLSDEDRACSVVFIQDAFTSHFETDLILHVIELVQRLGFKTLAGAFQAQRKAAACSRFSSAFPTRRRGKCRDAPRAIGRRRRCKPSCGW